MRKQRLTEVNLPAERHCWDVKRAPRVDSIPSASPDNTEKTAVVPSFMRGYDSVSVLINAQ